MYTLIDHTADVGIRIYGDTEAGLFENAALALTDLLTEPQKLSEQEERDIEVQGVDRAFLLVDWLRKVLSLFVLEEKLVCRVQVASLGPTELAATAGLAAFDPAIHEIRREIKAVTWHQASVERTASGWTGTVIFDT